MFDYWNEHSLTVKTLGELLCLPSSFLMDKVKIIICLCTQVIAKNKEQYKQNTWYIVKYLIMSFLSIRSFINDDYWDDWGPGNCPAGIFSFYQIFRGAHIHLSINPHSNQ